MATTHTSELDVEIDRGVAIVTLNRPHVMNARISRLQDVERPLF